MMGAARLDWGFRAGEVKGRNAYRLIQRDLAAAIFHLLAAAFIAALLYAARRMGPDTLPSREAVAIFLGCLIYAAAWRLGFRRLAHFDRERRVFLIESRFLLLFRLAEEGRLEEIRWVRWKDPDDPSPPDPHLAPDPGVAIGYRDREVTIAESDLGAGEDDALALANWLRRPFLRTGQEPPARAPEPGPTPVPRP